MLKKLLVIISNENKDMIKFALNFTLNVKQSGNYEDVKLFFFGPSQKIISENEDLQKLFVKVVQDGKFTPVACINVSNAYGIKQKLEEIGFHTNVKRLKTIKHRNHTYYVLSRKGELFLREYEREFGEIELDLKYPYKR